MPIISPEVTVESCNYSISIADYNLIQPGSCSNGGNGQLCSGGSISFTLYVTGCPNTAFELVLLYGSVRDSISVSLGSSGDAYVGYQTASITSGCFLGACTSNCSYTFTWYLENIGQTVIYAQTSGLKINMDCSCSC